MLCISIGLSLGIVETIGAISPHCKLWRPPGARKGVVGLGFVRDKMFYKDRWSALLKEVRNVQSYPESLIHHICTSYRNSRNPHFNQQLGDGNSAGRSKQEKRGNIEDLGSTRHCFQESHYPSRAEHPAEVST